MSHFKILFRRHSPRAMFAIVLPLVGCIGLLFSAVCSAQLPPQAPRDMPAWQPPETQVSTTQSFAPPAVTKPQTTMVDLQPPRDIFTQRSPQPQERIAARPLNESWPKPVAKSGFDLQNAISENFGDSIAKANLETTTLPDHFGGFADNAAEKVDGVRDWMEDKTSSFLSNAESTLSGEGGWLDRLSSMLGGADIKKIGGSLSIVLGGYLGLVWLLRKVNPAGNNGIPTEVLEVVGNAPLDNRQNLQLVRLGSKLLLMIHGPDGTQPIGEVTDPAEVDHLVALCNGRTRTASSAVSRAVNRHQSNQAGGTPLNLSANQQNNLTQLLSALDQTNRGLNVHNGRTYEA